MPEQAWWSGDNGPVHGPWHLTATEHAELHEQLGALDPLRTWIAEQGWHPDELLCTWHVGGPIGFLRNEPPRPPRRGSTE
ncbi:MAG: hypothetical protein K0Q93_2162 [Nocardioidaceae bacterium]|nr:hypothetical protein [Nocardioidaceae bacterium]